MENLASLCLHALLAGFITSILVSVLTVIGDA